MQWMYKTSVSSCHKIDYVGHCSWLQQPTMRSHTAKAEWDSCCLYSVFFFFGRGKFSAQDYTAGLVGDLHVKPFAHQLIRCVKGIIFKWAPCYTVHGAITDCIYCVFWRFMSIPISTLSIQSAAGSSGSSLDRHLRTALWTSGCQPPTSTPPYLQPLLASGSSSLQPSWVPSTPFGIFSCVYPWGVVSPLASWYKLARPVIFCFNAMPFFSSGTMDRVTFHAALA